MSNLPSKSLSPSENPSLEPSTILTNVPTSMPSIVPSTVPNISRIVTFDLYMTALGISKIKPYERSVATTTEAFIYRSMILPSDSFIIEGLEVKLNEIKSESDIISSSVHAIMRFKFTFFV
mmetsp:Transcript_46737/g.91258  ORF Transcript_46737/g.91258 Transcript_46737/m.91258 type:complete len:121 (-) Transcript_46737:21-383(-)